MGAEVVEVCGDDEIAFLEVRFLDFRGEGFAEGEVRSSDGDNNELISIAVKGLSQRYKVLRGTGCGHCAVVICAMEARKIDSRAAGPMPNAGKRVLGREMEDAFPHVFLVKRRVTASPRPTLIVTVQSSPKTRLSRSLVFYRSKIWRLG